MVFGASSGFALGLEEPCFEFHARPCGIVYDDPGNSILTFASTSGFTLSQTSPLFFSTDVAAPHEPCAATAQEDVGVADAGDFFTVGVVPAKDGDDFGDAIAASDDSVQDATLRSVGEVSDATSPRCRCGELEVAFVLPQGQQGVFVQIF